MPLTRGVGQGEASFQRKGKTMTDVAQPAPKRGNRLRPFIWGFALFLLLLPAAAMQFTPEVDWTASDFVIWGIMLTAACSLYELAARMSGNGFYRAGFGLAVVTGFLITWSNLAVGIIGNEDDLVNLLFFALLGCGFIGAALTGFRAKGLALVMTGLGSAQLLIALVAFGAGWDARGATFSLVFVGLWFTSAALFRQVRDPV